MDGDDDDRGSYGAVCQGVEVYIHQPSDLMKLT